MFSLSISHRSKRFCTICRFYSFGNFSFLSFFLSFPVSFYLARKAPFLQHVIKHSFSHIHFRLNILRGLFKGDSENSWWSSGKSFFVPSRSSLPPFSIPSMSPEFVLCIANEEGEEGSFGGNSLLAFPTIIIELPAVSTPRRSRNRSCIYMYVHIYWNLNTLPMIMYIRVRLWVYYYNRVHTMLH